MPLFKEWTIGDHGLAAIWKIEEPEDFFRAQTGLEPSVAHERKRIEHLAGRYLLLYLEKDFPLLDIGRDEHDKPRIADNRFYFSISHSWPYVAAMIDPHNEAGIDIQTWHKNIIGIQHKFLSPAEQALFGNDPRLVTVAWCAKEAAYKWNGRRGVDFIQHLPITFFERGDDITNIQITIEVSQVSATIHLKNLIYNDFACSFIADIDSRQLSMTNYISM